MTTGWPPGLLQDDSRELARWFASRIDARKVVREVCAEIAKGREQMTTPHKHKDVLIAIAEGREVQFKYENSWVGLGTTEGFNPIEHPGFEWRVKPQKLAMWVNLYPEIVYESRESAEVFAGNDRIACVRVEFEDGEGL